MIQIHKAGHAVPKMLLTRGAAETARLQAGYDAGVRSFTIHKSIYGGKAVKSALVKIQHKKCVFCEAKITATSHGDVEHYRPKGGFVQEDGDALTQPGYYWLAYDWSNLFFSCQVCNQTYKKNYFPLANPAGRALSHHHPVAVEDALIVHPADENPEVHLTFRKEVVKGVTPKGAETVKRTGIDRGDLEEQRFEYLRVLEELAKVARSSIPEAAAARSLFKELGLPDKQFSAMVKANFSDLV
jgi:uncharacterized protein (TIGR02646 family)